MNLGQLEYPVAATGHRSILKAAQSIRISQPSVRQTVSMAHASDRPLSRAACAMQAMPSGILRARLAEGWWRPATSAVSAPVALRA